MEILYFASLAYSFITFDLCHFFWPVCFCISLENAAPFVLAFLRILLMGLYRIFWCFFFDFFGCFVPVKREHKVLDYVNFGTNNRLMRSFELMLASSRFERS